MLFRSIEKIKPIKADVITSRTMASLKDLINYTYRFCKKETLCIFPKGKKYQEEIDEAKQSWKFDCEIKDSEQSEEGKILLIKNIAKR